jgi:type I restriction enzyme, S subunit
LVYGGAARMVDAMQMDLDLSGGSGGGDFPTVTLDDVSEKIDYGLTASATDKEDGPKFLRITDIQDDRVDWSTVPFCLCSAEESRRNALSAGDIVFARTGATTGKSFLVRHCPEGAVFASYLIRVRPSKKIDSAYLARFFQTPNYWHQITRSATGTAQPGVNASSLKKLQIPLPSLAEQQRIAAILDKADRIRQKRKETIRLTEELLRSAFLEMFGDPVTNPKGWDVKPLGDLLDVVSGQVDPKEMPYASMLHIGGDNIESHTGRLGELKTPKELGLHSGKYLFEPQDVLYSKIRPYLNKVVIPGFQGICSADIYPLRVKAEKLDQNYLVQLLRSNSFLIYAESHSARTNIPKINRPALLNYPALLPPIQVQQSFSKVCGRICELHTRIMKNEQQSENLFNALLQRAFKGQL